MGARRSIYEPDVIQSEKRRERRMEVESKIMEVEAQLHATPSTSPGWDALVREYNSLHARLDQINQEKSTHAFESTPYRIIVTK